MDLQYNMCTIFFRLHNIDDNVIIDFNRTETVKDYDFPNKKFFIKVIHVKNDKII